MKLAIDRVFWAQGVPAGPEFAKTLKSDESKGLAIWFLGNGVLVEERGKADKFVPLAQVLTLEAGAGVTAEQWTGTQKPSGDATTVHGPEAAQEQVQTEVLARRASKPRR